MIVCIARDGQEIGQHPEEAVPQLVADGELLPTDHYWHEGMEEWALVGDRWPSQKPVAAPPRRTAPVFQAPPPTKAARSSNRWIIVAAVAAVLAGAGAYFYFVKPSAPPPVVAAPGGAATPTPTAQPEPTQKPTPAADKEPSPTPVAQASPASAEKTATVVAWNLEWYAGRGPKASLEQQEAHKRVVKTELLKLDPDVFLAQEIGSWDVFIDLCSVVSGLDAAIVSHHMQGKEVGRQQTAIASKLPVVAAWYDNWKPAKPQPPRGYAMAAIQVPKTNKLLLFYSLHLKSNLARGEKDTKANYDQRDESIRQLLAHIDVMENQTFKGRVAGVIVGGDFNTNHDGQFGDGVIEMLTEAGFVNTWSEVPREKRHTWRGSDRYEPTTFDYIMTKGLELSTAQLIPVEEAASDHWPVKLELQLPKP